MGVRATVQNGRLIVDEATELPDGTVLDLVLDDEGDSLNDAKRALLDAAIDKGIAQVDSGQIAPASNILAQLRNRRR